MQDLKIAGLRHNVNINMMFADSGQSAQIAFQPHSDGLDGIKIGQGLAAGEAHLCVQQMALALRSRGIVLAVSSKNTDEISRKVFQDHPDMLLRESDIALFRINWTDKAANVENIAETLNLGLQSFVFLDDNPAERARVREALPEVAVPDV